MMGGREVEELGGRILGLGAYLSEAGDPAVREDATRLFAAIADIASPRTPSAAVRSPFLNEPQMDPVRNALYGEQGVGGLLKGYLVSGRPGHSRLFIAVLGLCGPEVFPLALSAERAAGALAKGARIQRTALASLPRGTDETLLIGLPSGALIELPEPLAYLHIREQERRREAERQAELRRAAERERQRLYVTD
jgi:hypothetical protein